MPTKVQIARARARVAVARLSGETLPDEVIERAKIDFADAEASALRTPVIPAAEQRPVAPGSDVDGEGTLKAETGASFRREPQRGGMPLIDSNYVKFDPPEDRPVGSHVYSSAPDRRRSDSLRNIVGKALAHPRLASHEIVPIRSNRSLSIDIVGHGGSAGEVVGRDGSGTNAIVRHRDGGSDDVLFVLEFRTPASELLFTDEELAGSDASDPGTSRQ